MEQTMFYQDIVKPAMEENKIKYQEIIAGLKNQETVEKKISDGVKELEIKRSKDNA